MLQTWNSLFGFRPLQHRNSELSEHQGTFETSQVELPKITATWKKNLPTAFSNSEMGDYKLPPAQTAARQVPLPYITNIWHDFRGLLHEVKMHLPPHWGPWYLLFFWRSLLIVSTCPYSSQDTTFPWNTQPRQELYTNASSTGPVTRMTAPQSTHSVLGAHPRGKRNSQCLEKGTHHIFQQQSCWLRKQVFICRMAAASNISRCKGMTVMALKLLCPTNFKLCQRGDWKDRKQH